MTRRALVIHHLRTGVPDLATEALAQAGYALDHRYPIEGDALPMPEEGHAVALVHGSLADVTQHHAPGIAEEMRWIEAWWATERPYFGICHGLQLAAQLLGARVGPPAHGHAEFGFYPLISHAPDLVPDGLHAFQWHYYGADLPHGAERLASTELYPNQIVRFAPARYGLQLHAEQPEGGRRYLRSQDADGPRRPGGQRDAEEAVLAARHGAAMEAWFSTFFARWLAATPKTPEETMHADE
ncbi:MAG: hypothetical protein AAF183_22335 [Pseudomonadota bacterium]